MLRLDRLLCLVSPAASPSTALRQALHLASVRDAAVQVVVIGGAGAPADVWKAVEAEKRRLDRSVSVEVHTGEGLGDGKDVLGDIEEHVEKTGADLVLADPLPNRGPDSWGHALAERLDCPLFMVDACADPDRVERILVPTDLSPSSVNTLRHAIGVANCYEASIVLLHVLEASPYVALTPMDRLSLGATTLSEHRARRRLRHLVKKAGAADGDVHPRLAFGAPAEQITRFVDENDVDLVVLSLPEAGSHSDRVLGPVPDRLLRRLACPFFLVRPFERSLLTVEGGREAENRRGKGDDSSVSSSR